MPPSLRIARSPAQKNILLWSPGGIALFFAAGATLFAAGDALLWWPVAGLFLLANFGIIHIAGGSRASLAPPLAITLTWILITGAALSGEGLRSPVIVLYPALTLLAAVLRGRRASLVTGAICLLTTLALSFHPGTAVWLRTPVNTLAALTASIVAIVLAHTHSRRELTGEIDELRDQLHQSHRQTEALSASEGRFRDIVENARDAIFIKDRDLRYIFVNRSLTEMFELPAEQVVGKVDSDLPDLPPTPEIEAADRRVLAGEQVEVETRRILHGRLRFFNSIRIPHRTPDGEVVGLCGIDRDITEYKAEQEKLFEASQRLRSLIANSLFAVIEWDASHHVTSWTGAAEHIFGWSADEVLGKRVDQWRFVHEDDWNIVHRSMQAMEQGHGYTVRNRNYRKDGTVILSEWYGSVLHDQSGHFLSGLSLVLDVTQRHLAEEALRASEEKFRHMFELAPIGIFQSTPEGRFIQVNHTLASMFGYESPEQMLNSVAAIGEQLFVRPEQRRALVDHALESRAFVQGEVEYRRADGSILMANLFMRAAFHAARGEDHLEGFVTDISARKAAEDALRVAYEELERRVQERTAELSAANDRLQELDRLKSQFLASMSHELRTPLNSIIGFTSLLRQGLSGPVTAEQKKQLTIVNDSSKHLLALINDLLDVSRIEAGRADLEIEPFEFNGVLEDAIRSLQPMAERKGLRLVYDPPSRRIEMVGDRKRNLQVLLNLVNNAVKFTAQGGVTVITTVQDEVLQVSVEDTGIGIKPEHLGMLFEAFRQVDGSAKRVYEGTGLGLYLCRKLLRLMGGSIGVESEYGKGSRFHYSLPLRLAGSHAPNPEDIQ